jgi:hypothetical protein
LSHRYYGLWLWFPELFNKLSVYYKLHNETVSVCEVTNFVAPGLGSEDSFCKVKNVYFLFENKIKNQLSKIGQIGKGLAISNVCQKPNVTYACMHADYYST